MTDCDFVDTARGFYCKGLSRVTFRDNTADCAATNCQALCATEDCNNVSKSDNVLLGAKWTDYDADDQPFQGGAALYGYGDKNVQICHNETFGFQMVFNGKAFQSERLVFNSNIVDTPVGDCGFQNWAKILGVGNQIRMSGDMGISTDQSDYVVLSGNVIEDSCIGAINIGGATSGAVVGNVIRNWMQAFDLIEVLANRHASTAGAWGCAIGVGFQGLNDGGTAITITGNSISMPTLPPVLDGNGGAVRAVALGIFVAATPSIPSTITGVIGDNYVDAAYADLPLCFVHAPTHYFYASAHSGAPIVGETFADGDGKFLPVPAICRRQWRAYHRPLRRHHLPPGRCSPEHCRVRPSRRSPRIRSRHGCGMRVANNVDFWDIEFSQPNPLHRDVVEKKVPGNGYTLKRQDAGGTLVNASGGAETWTIPPDVFPVGVRIWVGSGGSQVNLARGSGVVLYGEGGVVNADKVLANGGGKVGMAMLYQFAANEWWLSNAF